MANYLFLNECKPIFVNNSPIKSVKSTWLELKKLTVKKKEKKNG